MNTSSSFERKIMFECEICGKILAHKTKLVQHIGSIHEGKKPFRCDICDYSCFLKSDIKNISHQFMKKRSHSNAIFVTTAALKKVI